MTWIYLLKLKSDVIIIIRTFLQIVHTQFNKTVKAIRADNGTEFINKSCADLLQSHGIIHQKTCVYTPQQNGVAERSHRYILEVAISIRFQSSIPLRFWGHCVLGAVYMINMMPYVSLQGKTPHEVFHKCKPSMDHIRTMGCLCYTKKLPVGDKFEARAVKVVIWGTLM